MAKLHLRGVRAAQVGALLGGGGGNDETDNETVKSKRFRENEDKNHTDVELGLLGVGAHASVPAVPRCSAQSKPPPSSSVCKLQPPPTPDVDGRRARRDR